MKKSYLAIMLILVSLSSILSACGNSTSTVSNKKEQEVAKTFEQNDTEKENTEDINDKEEITKGEETSDDSVGIEDELYNLVVEALGSGSESLIENIAADATTVKFLLNADTIENAQLCEFSILYKMKGKYNMTVKFVFYSEKGNVNSAILRDTFSQDTLQSIDFDEIKDYRELKNYAN